MMAAIYPTLHHGSHDRPITVRVREACRLTGIGRSKLYELISKDEIQTIKIGAITLIPMDSLCDFIARHHHHH